MHRFQVRLVFISTISQSNYESPFGVLSAMSVTLEVQLKYRESDKEFSTTTLALDSGIKIDDLKQTLREKLCEHLPSSYHQAYVLLTLISPLRYPF